MKAAAKRPQGRTGFERLRWPALIKRRDHWRCRAVDCATPKDRIQAHHLCPLSEGGESTMANGVTLCHEHHRAIHRGDHLEFTDAG